MSPKAAAHAVAASDERWYQIYAATDSHPLEITIYGVIGWDVSAQQFINDAKASGLFEAKNIAIRLHTPGGDVMDGFAIFNILSGLSAKIDIYVDGMAASMGSVLACLPNGTLHMPENAWLMIHKPWGGSVGDADDLRDYAEFLDRNEAMLLKAYTGKTGKSEEEIKAMLKPDTWLNGAEAKEQGFVDHVIAPLKAAALLTHRTEELNMPKALQSLMGARAEGGQPPATPNAAAPVVPAAPAPTPAPVAQQSAPVTAPPSAADLQAQFKAQEQGRQAEIRDLFALAGNRHLDLMATCLGNLDTTPAQARASLLEAMGRDTTPSTPANGAHIHAGNGNIVGDSIAASIMARAGFANAEADNNYNHMTLRELARASLADRGVGVASYNPMQMVGMSFTHTSSDFGNILLDVAHKALLQGWEEAEETFQLWTKRGQLSDFKTSKRVGMGEFPSLRQVREGAEYKHITVGDTGEQIQLATYGELFGITRQAIINDDLGALIDIPMKMGMAAKATIGDLVYAVLMDNPKLSDGKALFHADHKNTTTGALSIESLDAARAMMRTQRTMTEGGKARSLNIRPAYVLTPVSLESKAKQIIGSASVPGAETNSGIENPLRNFAEVIAEPRLDGDAGTNKQWYLAAKAGSDTIEVAYLNGIDTPYIEQQQGFTSDGIATKVRIDAGVAPLDYRGLARSTGV
ncbi:Clp protease ClpP [Oceanisphaera sediminis]|uniref:ATP-dependent Clp protease proteolytic subunit n=1 Tax=Oceanisphaera sediminis TaxID=981381 RepID=A0ABP7DDQ4_9GAMM